jgi:hypothetical protein
MAGNDEPKNSLDFTLVHILAQNQTMSDRLDVLGHKIVSREELRHDFDDLKDKIEKIDENLDELSEKVATIQKNDIVIQTKLEQNSNWIRNFENAIKWSIRVVIVAGLGMVATFVTQFINHENQIFTQPQPIPISTKLIP